MIERLLDAERNLQIGFVDRAEAIYRGLAESDPRNAVAVVGLARCALERGDERGAYDLAVRALGIDPEDTAALRMEARLSEVLATRGRPVRRPDFVMPDGAPRSARAWAPAPASVPAPAPAPAPEIAGAEVAGAESAPARVPAVEPEATPPGTDRPQPEPEARRNLLRRMLGRR